jgi:type IV secretory pathway VirD2 relaxase
MPKQNSAEDIHELILRVRSVRRLPSEKSMNKAVWRTLVHDGRSSRHVKGSGHYFSFAKNMQSSIVKVSYTGNKHSGQWKAHGRYLEREGAQIEGERGKGFDMEGDEVSLAKTLDTWQKDGDPYFFKIIVSPQEGERLDLKEHVQHLVQRMQEDLRTTLQWAAIDHYNTDQPHLHLIIRAKDANGNILSMDRQYIKQGIRQRSQEEATQKLGIRLEDDVLRRRQQSITKKRLTEIDREILKMKDNDNRITFEGKLPVDHFQTEKRLQLIGRLQFLESMGFARKAGVLTWKISAQMEEGLKTYQLSQDITKRSARFMGRISDSNLPLVYSPLKEGDQVAGRVIGMGLHNELHDKRFMLIEGIDGKVHYIHPPKDMIKLRDKREILNGDIVYLQVKTYFKEGQKRAYLHFQKYRNISALMQTNEPGDIDRYVAKLLSHEKDLIKNLNPSTFQGEFLGMMEKRLQKLRMRGLKMTA